VPAGTYVHLDPADGHAAAVEVFRCAGGPAGWQYTADVRDPDGRPRGRLDVTVDGAGRQVRVELVSAGWRIRGGVAGAEAIWLRAAADGTSAMERSAQAAGFVSRSPAFLLAELRRLRLGPGGRARVRLVELVEPALATLLVDQEWVELGVTEHPTEIGPLPVRRYRIADLATGAARVVHVAGDVLVAAPHIELAALDGAPTLN